MPSVDLTYFMEELAAINKGRGKFIAHTMSFVRERAVAEDTYIQRAFSRFLRRGRSLPKGIISKGISLRS